VLVLVGIVALYWLQRLLESEESKRSRHNETRCLDRCARGDCHASDGVGMIAFAQNAPDPAAAR
jgi:hypothetical protein